MSTMHALVLTDRADRSEILRQLLDRAIECTVLDISNLRTRLEPVAGVIVNADITKSGVKRRIHAFLSALRPPQPPLLVLTPARTERSFAEARTLGASVWLPQDVPPANVVTTFLAYICQDVPIDELVTRRALDSAERALASLLDTVREHGSVDVAALDTAVTFVLDAVETGGIARCLEFIRDFDDLTHQHCLLVAGLAAAVAFYLGFSLLDRLQLTRAALVHDVGKARIPHAILNKPASLTRDEMMIMRTHAALGYEILLASGGFDAATLDVVRHHHEMLDGSGYPDGLSGVDVADRVRLITICDIYAALIEKRPYRAPTPAPRAIAILREMGGKLDGDLLNAFDRAVRSGSHGAAEK